MKFKQGLIIASITGSSLLPLKGNSQILQNTKKQELIETLDNHDSILNTNISDLINKYGEIETLNIINKHMMIEMNKLRTKAGVTELAEISPQIKEEAQKLANLLAPKDTAYHLDGEDILRKRFRKAGIPFFTCSENLAQGQKTIDKAIKDWLLSPGHKANILKNVHRKIGVGYKNGIRVVNWTD